MSRSYLFFAPLHLPLTPAALSEETVRGFTDRAEVQTMLGAHMPELAWNAGSGDALASAVVMQDDTPYEFTISCFTNDELIVALRCSGRVNSEPFVQRICDATGWIAFDDRPFLFQPHRPPVEAGHG